MPRGKKSVERRNERRAEAAEIRCANGCGRQVARQGETCATCKAKKS